MRRLLICGIVAAASILPLSACGSSGGGTDNAACGNALDSYHTALVASDVDGTGPNLPSNSETAHQNDVVQNCDEAQFVALIKGPGYDYSSGVDAIAVGDPHNVYRAFCSGATGDNQC